MSGFLSKKSWLEKAKEARADQDMRSWSDRALKAEEDMAMLRGALSGLVAVVEAARWLPPQTILWLTTAKEALDRTK